MCLENGGYSQSTEMLQSLIRTSGRDREPDENRYV
jgi:hypothetical protein